MFSKELYTSWLNEPAVSDQSDKQTDAYFSTQDLGWRMRAVFDEDIVTWLPCLETYHGGVETETLNYGLRRPVDLVPYMLAVETRTEMFKNFCEQRNIIISSNDELLNYIAPYSEHVENTVREQFPEPAATQYLKNHIAVWLKDGQKQKKNLASTAQFPFNLS